MTDPNTIDCIYVNQTEQSPPVLPVLFFSTSWALITKLQLIKCVHCLMNKIQFDVHKTDVDFKKMKKSSLGKYK